MAIYYELTFGILVVEMVAFGLLVLPLPTRWRFTMLKFASTSFIMGKALYLLKIIFGFIFVLFIDTINRLQRIEAEIESDKARNHDYSYDTNLKAKRFYAQRNLYLTGFTLFLSLILDRTSALVFELVQRKQELKEVRIKSAEATTSQRNFVDMEDDYKKKIDSLNVQIKELKRQQLDYNTLKKQADQQSKEYNRLADEHNALEKKKSGTIDEVKKDI
ncbi:B-cell receptor-associated protein 31-like-domain-containing protein [Mycotypha africana]|uniref:B-cell receptor-associated protein 31-like-domain-containing protein n=1 Tax=Mycotypha africana TaxID=64632 RepID=UPI0023012326|nr:B-cell receptor-associated protein 31-like-domain-containing protein [Mycotypha africana]KAI8987988.1 B-cell receptor-associated protein 31-like-domain-containing protein [Mycotypha africana]